MNIVKVAMKHESNMAAKILILNCNAISTRNAMKKKCYFHIEFFRCF